MILHMFSVRDAAAEAFLPPFHVRSKLEAIRSFTDAVRKEGHQFNSHAHDYVLFAIGSFDDNSGLITAIEPVRVLSGIECVAASD